VLDRGGVGSYVAYHSALVFIGGGWAWRWTWAGLHATYRAAPREVRDGAACGTDAMRGRGKQGKAGKGKARQGRAKQRSEGAGPNRQATQRQEMAPDQERRDALDKKGRFWARVASNGT
jgi:hypothetical protein